VARRPADWQRYAAPAAFLAVATIAIVLVTSALHHASGRKTPAPTTAVASKPPPAKTRSVKTTTVGKRRFYTVVAGDTFGVIAGKTGTSVEELGRLNPGISSTSLHIGQKLRIA
jgi:LysM repeat protein